MRSEDAMRRSIPSLLLLLLVAALGFVGWQLVSGSRRQAQLVDEVAALRQQQEQMRATLQESRDSLDAMREQQERVRETLSESRESLLGANDRASLLMREDLHVAAVMRTAVAEYYMSTGRMPEQPALAGLARPEQYRGKTLRSATVLDDGSIELEFDAASGVDGGRIRFVADTSRADAMGLQWQCVTADYPLIARVTPACEYRSGAGLGDVPAKP